MDTQFLQKIAQNQMQQSYFSGWNKALQNFEQTLAEEKKLKKTAQKHSYK